MTPRPEFARHETVDELAEVAARAVVEVARASLTARDRFIILLSGGDSPRRTYELLAGHHRADIDWERTDVFFSDERCVPPTDSRNNFAMARDLLLSRVPVPADRIFPVPTVGEPTDLAERYEWTLRAQLGEGTATFDLAIMGMGADGHTASLFPGDASLRESARWALAVRAPATAEVADRITLTLPVLNRSRRVLFIVSGRKKRDAVRRVAAGESLPAARVAGREQTLWLLDGEA